MYVILVWEDADTVGEVIGPFRTKTDARVYVEKNSLVGVYTIYMMRNP